MPLQAEGLVVAELVEVAGRGPPDPPEAEYKDAVELLVAAEVEGGPVGEVELVDAVAATTSTIHRKLAPVRMTMKSPRG